jgi:amino acid adenylation domain-containing protein
VTQDPDRYQHGAERFAMIARSVPDAPAVLDRGRRVTYRELDERSGQIAAWLTAQGVKPDEIVAVLVDRSADVPACVLAVWKAGCAYLALDPETPRGRLSSVFDHARPVAVLTHARLRHRIPPGPVPSLVVDRDSLPAPVSQPVASSPDQLAYVIYTSGSTGTPRAVGVSQRSLLTILDDWRRVFRLGSEVRSVMQVAGFGFDVATGDLARALLTGGCLITCPRDLLLSPPGMYELMRQAAPEFAEFTPALLRPLVSYLRQAGGRLDFMRCLVAGGEPWAAGDYRATREVAGPDVRIFNSYGLSEAAIDNTFFEAGQTVPRGECLPIGRAFSPTEVIVLDSRLKVAKEGELHIGGLQLARGYLGDPASTAERFVPAPEGPPGARLYRTGDIVRRQGSGDLSFVGRRDEQVKVRGVRVDPLEVQNALAAHPHVQAAVVVPGRHNGQVELAAYLLPASSAPAIDVGEARSFLARRLAGPMVPAFISVVDALPVNASGKVDRTRLPAPQRVTSRPAGGDDAGSVEDALLRICSAALGRTVTETDQDFFELGGSSLLAGQVAVQVRAELGVDLPAAALFNYPTVGELAAVVARAGAAGAITADPGRTEGPLSPGQNRLWVMHQVDQDGCAAYNIPAVVQIAGPLDVRCLTEALNQLITRHAVLRTSFMTTAAGPLQRVCDGGLVNLVELTADVGPVTDAWMQAFARRPFDLRRPPLLRAALLDLPSAGHQLILVMHHLVSDGWTLRLLLRELGEIYSALKCGAAPSLPPQPMSYLDFAVCNAERLERGDFDHQLASWREHLQGYLPAPVLPAPVITADGPGRQRLRLGPDTTGAIRDLARDCRTTVFVTLLAAFAGLLQRWSGQDDFVVGVPFGDRTIPGTESLAGFFVNTAPVRFQLPGDGTFADLARLTRARVAHSAANQDVPFDLVQQELRRNGAGAEFQVWFNFLGAPDAPPAMAGLDTEILQPPLVGALFDLNIYITELSDDLEIDAIYDSSQCDGSYVTALIQQYAALLRRVTIDPGLPMSAHALGAAAAPAPVRPVRDFPSLPSLLAEQAARMPEAPALRTAHGELSYAQLEAWAGAVAGRLASRRVRPGDVVAVYLPRGAALVAALVGVLKAGAAFCVLDPAHPEGRLTTQVMMARPAAALCAAGADSLPASIWPAVASVIEIGDGPAVMSAGDGPVSRAERTAPPAAQIAYLAFSSGTTGTPKAVRGGQAPVVHFIRWYAARFRLTRQDRFAMLSGLAHDPLLRDVFAPLCTGAVLCVPAAGLIRMPRELRAWLAAERVTVAHLTPPLIRLLAEAPGIPLADLRLVVSGGDMLYGADVTLLRQIAPNATVVNVYGTTETPQAMSWQELAPGDPAGPPTARIPIGRGIQGVELQVHREAGQLAAVGELGRIVVRTPYLTDGLGDEYDTGDLGRYRPDGQIELTGRADDQVKIAGFRVQPAEVDACIRQLPYIRECLTVAAPGPDGQPCLVTYAAPEVRVAPTLERLRGDLRADLPAYLLPSGLVLLPRLPITPSGKPDRSALPPWAPATEDTPTAPPGSALQKRIAAIWRGALGGVSISIDANFFDLGGSSMLMIRVQQQLEADLGQPVPVLTLFEHPTIRSLADYLSDRLRGTPAVRPAAAAQALSDGRHRLRVRQEIRLRLLS